MDEAANFVDQLVQNKHYRDLRMSPDSFRIIVNRLVQLEKGENASLVMVRAQSYVPIYKLDFKNVSTV